MVSLEVKLAIKKVVKTGTPAWLARLYALPEQERPKKGDPCPCHGQPMRFMPGSVAGTCECGGVLIFTTGGHGGLICLSGGTPLIRAPDGHTETHVCW